VSRSAHRGASWAGGGENVVAAAQESRVGRVAEEWGEDWCSLKGALELARRIERHWAERGRACRCRIVPAGFGLYAVQSDLCDALPPGPPAERARGRR
jgi:hypothetical protein